MLFFFFNADHDLALANGSPHYQAPATIELMNRDLETLMAWFTTPHHPSTLLLRRIPPPRYIDHLQSLLGHPISLLPLPVPPRAGSFTLSPTDQLIPWGFDPRSAALTTPSHPHNETLTQLSSKTRLAQWIPSILPLLAPFHTNVLTHNVSTWEEVEARIAIEPTVVRDPLSSSGKGVRIMEANRLNRYDVEWCTSVLRSRGNIVLSTRVDKLHDWSIQFHIHPHGAVTLTGLSLFHTNSQGAYAGNLILPNHLVRHTLHQHVHPTEVDSAILAIRTLLECEVAPHYSGPCGADMMIFRDGHNTRIYPLVELNLRHTMGLLSLRLHQALHSRTILPPNACFRIVDRHAHTLLSTSSPHPPIILTPVYPDTHFVGLITSHTNITPDPITLPTHSYTNN